MSSLTMRPYIHSIIFTCTHVNGLTSVSKYRMEKFKKIWPWLQAAILVTNLLLAISNAITTIDNHAMLREIMAR
jgi:hypothetical protein